MATVNQKVILTFDAETGEILEATSDLQSNLDGAAKSAENIDKSLDDVADSAKEAEKETKKIEKGAKGLGIALKNAAGAGVRGLKRLGGALKSSGIGLFLDVWEKLKETFTSTKERADQLEVIMSKLDIVFFVVADSLGGLLDKIIKFAEDPGRAMNAMVTAVSNALSNFTSMLELKFIKGLRMFQREILEMAQSLLKWVPVNLSKQIGDVDKAIADLDKEIDNLNGTLEDSPLNPNKVGKYIDGILEYQEAMGKLTKEFQKLADADRALAVQTSRSSAEIENLKKTRDDERLSFEERIEAAQKAQVIESALVDQQVSNARRRIRLIKERIELQGETEDNLNALTEAEVMLSDAQAASAGVQTELMTSIYGINQARLDQEQAIADMRRMWVTEQLEGIEAEKASIEDQYRAEVATINRLILTEEEKGQLRYEAEQARNRRLEKLEKDHQEEMESIRQEGADAALQARYDLEDELYEAGLSAYEREELALMRLYDLRVAIAGDDEGLIKKAAEQLYKDLEDLSNNAQETAVEGAFEVASNAVDALGALNEAFMGVTIEQERELQAQEEQLAQARFDASMREWELNEALIHAETDAERQALEQQLVDEKNASAQSLYQLELANYEKQVAMDKDAKKQFEINKAVAITQALIQTGLAVTAALTAGGNPLKLATGAQFVEAALALSTGLAQVQTIRSQTYQSQAGTPPMPPQTQTAGGAGGGAGGFGAPQLDLSFLGEGAGQEAPIQAYVLAQDVSNAQQANQQIQDQATL